MFRCSFSVFLILFLLYLVRFLKFEASLPKKEKKILNHNFKYRRTKNGKPFVFLLKVFSKGAFTYYVRMFGGFLELPSLLLT